MVCQMGMTSKDSLDKNLDNSKKGGEGFSPFSKLVDINGWKHAFLQSFV